jgi:hypothetical protein
MTLPVNPTPKIGLSRPDFDVATWHDAINDNFTLIDTLLASVGVPSVDGTWQNNTAYVVGDRLFDGDDASLWICSVDHTSAVSGTFAEDRVAHPTYWDIVLNGVSFRDAWVGPGTVYSIGDLVSDSAEGLALICKVAHTSTSSIRTDMASGYWATIADFGDVVSAVSAFMAQKIVTFVVSGGSVVLSTGPVGAYATIPFASKVTGWRILNDVSGSIDFDIWKDTYANFPPTVADSIIGTDTVGVTSDVKNEDLTVTGWTNFVAGDVVTVNINSVTSVMNVQLVLFLEPL